MHFLLLKDFVLGLKKPILLVMLLVLFFCLFISLGFSDVLKEVTPPWMLLENLGSFKNLPKEGALPAYPYLYGSLEADLNVLAIQAKKALPEGPYLYGSLEADLKFFGIEPEEALTESPYLYGSLEADLKFFGIEPEGEKEGGSS
jgi:hypothetical protein